jgi:solute carrier family 25 phosphate transporter 23/24/25/41
MCTALADQGVLHLSALKDADGLVKEMLTQADVDHDGKISYDEFRRFCHQTERELWGLFQAIDRDRSGELDKAEVAAAFERAGVTVSNARLNRFFDYIDKDHNGTIDFSEWRGAYQELGSVSNHSTSSIY